MNFIKINNKCLSFERISRRLQLAIVKQRQQQNGSIKLQLARP